MNNILIQATYFPFFSLTYNRNEMMPHTSAYTWFIPSTADTVAIVAGVMKKYNVVMFFESVVNPKSDRSLNISMAPIVCPMTIQ